jgi:L-cysteine desulfidase
LSIVENVLDLVNDVGAVGAKAIAKALKTNKSVTTINLRGEYYGA